jgi:hypothetical protein
MIIAATVLVEGDRLHRYGNLSPAPETVTERVNFHLTRCATFSTAHLSLILKKRDPMLACPYWLGSA